MKKEKFFLLSERTMQLIRLMGSFAVFGAAIMLLFSTAQMFESWDAVNGYSVCMNETLSYLGQETVVPGGVAGELEVEMLARARFADCRNALYNTTGVFPSVSSADLTLKQKFIAFVRPLAMIFFWAVIFFFGIILYSARNLGFSVIEAPHEKHAKKESKKE